MSKYIVETFYTCSFKIVHKLDELNEKKLSELENRNDGEFQIIDVKLNNRKTKTGDKKQDLKDYKNKSETKNLSGISSVLSEKIIETDKSKASAELKSKSFNIQKFNKKNFSWQKQHEHNLTGTKKAHKPEGSLSSNSQKITKKYETWKY